MDERTAQRQADSEASPEPEPAPPIPPSPLAQPPEGVPHVPLPWSTPLFAAVAGFAAGASVEAISGMAATGLRVSASMIIYEGAIAAGTALLTVSGAAIADRLAPSWPPAARWACGTGAMMLAGVAAMLDAAYVVSGQVPGMSALQFLALAVTSSGPYALVGAALGLASAPGKGLFWRLPLAGCISMGATGVLGGAVFLAVGPLPIAGPLDGVSGMALGLLLGFTIAQRLNAARCAAMDRRPTNGEAVQ